jgi:hypothetical protein
MAAKISITTNATWTYDLGKSADFNDTFNLITTWVDAGN